MPDYFRRFFAFDHWANREILAALDAMPAPPPRAVELLGHLLYGQEFVLEALQGRFAAHLLDAPDPPLAECAALVETLAHRWAEYLSGQTETSLRRHITMLNSHGTPVTRYVPDLLTHAVNHATYHRGQIATAIRAHGGEPAQIDFTIFARYFPYP